MADKAASITVKRVRTDFNTLTSAPVGIVKLAAPGTWQEAELPPLSDGERVTLFDADGLEVEATVLQDEGGWWLATPDDATWRDAGPANPLPPPTSAR
jgi:hypothetical protein